MSLDVKIIDNYEQEINIGDYIAYATGTKIWVGKVVDIPIYIGDYDTLIKIQLELKGTKSNRFKKESKTSKHTFDYVPWKIYRIGNSL